MMSEKTPIKISLSTFFLVIAILIIIVMGIYLYIEKTNSDKTISELENSNADMEATIDNLQDKIDTISNTINSNTNANINNSQPNNTPSNEEVEFSDTEIKESITNYLNIFKGAGSVGGKLEKLGLLKFEDYSESTSDNYIKTDIKYSEFKDTILKYITEEWYNTINGNKKWEITEFKEVDGLLYYHGSGWTGTEYEVKSITVKGDYSDSRYIAEVYRINVDDSKELENIEFEIANYNGKCVISYCD